MLFHITGVPLKVFSILFKVHSAHCGMFLYENICGFTHISPCARLRAMCILYNDVHGHTWHIMVLAQIFRAEPRFSMTGKFISLQPPLLVQHYSIVHEASALCGGGGVFDFCPQGDNLMQSGGSNRRMPEVRRFTYNDKSCLLSARLREERLELEEP